MSLLPSALCVSVAMLCIIFAILQLLYQTAFCTFVNPQVYRFICVPIYCVPDFCSRVLLTGSYLPV